MLKKLLLVPLALLTLALTGCSASYSLTEAEINEYVSDRALSQTLGAPGLFELGVDLSDITVKLGQPAEDQLRVTGNSNLVIRAMGNEQEANVKLDFAAKPRYEPEEGALYVQNIEVISIETWPANYAAQIEPFLPQLMGLVEYFLQSQPVYRLDEQDKDQLLAKKVLKEVNVSPGKVTFKMSP